VGSKEEKLYVDRVKDRDIEINETVDALIKKHKRKIDNASKKVKSIGCQHHFYSRFQTMDDNGYGKWYEIEIKTCRVCGEKDVYSKWPLKER